LTVSAWLARADRAPASASLVADDGDFDRAANTAYHAMFYGARAALIHVGQPERAMGKTHSGMVAAFNQWLVRPGLLEAGLGKAFAFEQNRRILADYEEGGVDADGAADAIASVRPFVDAVKALIEQGDAPSPDSPADPA
jgi:uncharacterized protein (UPF0332 family)